jgi:hypothetical protein
MEIFKRVNASLLTLVYLLANVGQFMGRKNLNQNFGCETLAKNHRPSSCVTKMTLCQAATRIGGRRMHVEMKKLVPYPKFRGVAIQSVPFPIVLE